jgi:hypothetical protein
VSAKTRQFAPNIALLSGWKWMLKAPSNSWAAVLWTQEYDCTVSIENGSVSIPTGVAPVEIVAAVIKANKP